MTASPPTLLARILLVIVALAIPPRLATAQSAVWERSHSAPDPGFGTWTITLWDGEGKVVGQSTGAGFERYGPEEFRFIMPLEDRAPNGRIFHIEGAGQRGEWHDLAGRHGGWFEIASRPPVKELRRIEFTWHDSQSGGPPGRGELALIPD